MSINPYFSNYSFANTQNLLDDLVVQQIKITGFDVNYLPMSTINYDNILGEGQQMMYSNNYIIEMYPLSTTSWQSGVGDLFSKFGVEITDSVSFVVSRSRFENELEGVRTLPKERDVIYVPFNQSFMIITEVIYDSTFFPFGKNVIYELRTKLWDYSGEILNTGNTEIQSQISRYPVSNTAVFMPSDYDQIELEKPNLIDDSEQSYYDF